MTPEEFLNIRIPNRVTGDTIPIGTLLSYMHEDGVQSSVALTTPIARTGMVTGDPRQLWSRQEVRSLVMNDLVKAILESEQGENAEAILARIDQRAAEAQADRDAISAQVDEVRAAQAQLVSLVASYDAAEISAAEVAEALKAMVHGATAPDAEGNE